MILVDHDSTDSTHSIAETFLGHGLLRIESLDWAGSFSLADQLRVKQEIVASVSHDWVSHFDADEAPVAVPHYQRLLDAVADADQQGFNCLNFHELVFLPPVGCDRLPTEEFQGEYLDYYFFQPAYPRLMRLWRRNSGLSNLQAGGHQLSGEERRLVPVDLTLKHYIVLSREAARTKYLPRVFCAADLAKGWHANRVSIQEAAIDAYSHRSLERARRIQALVTPDDDQFVLTHPQQRHFWEWS